MGMDGIRKKLYLNFTAKHLTYMTGCDYMRIGFIGAGKVGFTLGKYITEKLKDTGISSVLSESASVSGYYSRKKESAREAARFTDTAEFDSLNDIVRSSDVLMLTVPDGAISTVWEEIKSFDIKDKIICHCSGAMTSQIFSGVTEAKAFGYSIHPMYAISSRTKSYMELGNAFFTVEGDEKYLTRIKRFINLCGNECVVISPVNKVKYHAAAVFASNLVTGLFDESVRLLKECGFSESEAQNAIAPMFLGNAEKISKNGAVNELTGPVERNDTDTVRRHLSKLSEDEKKIYISISKHLVEVAEKKHPDRSYEEMLRLLNDNAYSS